uniref:hypothetical protein n=1 Tax=Fulvivirga sp. TaxID=1931237 RepID=UPI00404B9CED
MYYFLHNGKYAKEFSLFCVLEADKAVMYQVKRVDTNYDYHIKTFTDRYVIDEVKRTGIVDGKYFNNIGKGKTAKLYFRRFLVLFNKDKKNLFK